MPIQKMRMAEENRSGMSRHAQCLLSKLKHELPPQLYAQLGQAFKNSWEYGRVMGRRLTFSQAVDFLREQTLYTVEIWYKPVAHKESHCVSRYVHWRDQNGNRVATVDATSPEQYTSAQLTVQVLGSEFEGTQARSLLECYKQIVTQKKEFTDLIGANP